MDPNDPEVEETDAPSSAPDSRGFLRLHNVCPVDYTIVRLQSGLPGVAWHKGKINNVSAGGLCLETRELKEPTIRHLISERIMLEMKIHLPLMLKPIRAVGEIQWYEMAAPSETEPKALLGVKFRNIPASSLRLLLFQAKILSFFSRMIVAVAVIVVILLIILLAIMMM